MALDRGIYIFYESHPSDNLTHLYWLHFNGRTVDNNGVLQQVASNETPQFGRGVSTLLYNELLYLFCTCTDNNVYIVQFDGENFLNLGAIPNLSSHDVTAPTVFGQSLQLFYKDAASNLLSCTTSTLPPSPGGTWAVQSNLFGVAPIDWGPAAVTMGGSTYIIFNENFQLRVCSVTSGPTIQSFWDLSPWYNMFRAPSAISLGDNLAILYVQKSDSTMVVAQLDPSNHWQYMGVPDITSYSTPSICAYGGKLFCFTQSSQNILLCQVYQGNQWLPLPVSMTQGQAPDSVWYGPCAVTI